MSDKILAKQSLCILIVEDEPGLQEAYALIFELEGYHVIRANDGREALAHLSLMRPDVILTDYMMPRMNGLEMIGRIRSDAQSADIPILLTSAALPHHVDKSAADAFLAKPIGISQLLSTVETLLGKK